MKVDLLTDRCIRKPKVYEAVQLRPTNEDMVKEWCEGSEVLYYRGERVGLVIVCAGGYAQISYGDHLIFDEATSVFSVVPQHEFENDYVCTDSVDNL